MHQRQGARRLLCERADGRSHAGAEAGILEQVLTGDRGPDDVAFGPRVLGMDGVDERVENACGTSFSAPHVTAAVALMRAVAPFLRPAEVRQILAATAADRGAPGWDPYFGHGILDAAAAVQAAARATPAAPVAPCPSA